MKTLLKPPEFIRGITVLKKELIKKNVNIPYISIHKSLLNNITPVLKKIFLKIEKFKAIQYEQENVANIYLSPDLITDWSSIPDDIKTSLESISVTSDNLKVKPIELQYDNFSAENLLRAILPEDKEGFSSFTRIGHIVHVNLREHLFPYKDVIGEILFDKISGCRSVVNKSNIIDNTYRNFSMEILKGDDDMVTTVKENNCNFTFDFSKVYWNSRLSTEHERIVKILKQNDVLFDVFAGVGPFSIPVAKKKCYVYSNDLNPDSFKWLEHNAKTNKICTEYFQSFNKDGKDFILNTIKENLPRHLTKERKVYITMNLPASAVDFLTHFEGLFDEQDLSAFLHPPTLFLYCFVKGEDYIGLTKDLLSNKTKTDITSNVLDIFRVRTVSSLKEMMRITIKLDREFLIGSRRKRKIEDSDDCCVRKLGKNGEEQEQEESR